jgi:hypothetical protein
MSDVNSDAKPRTVEVYVRLSQDERDWVRDISFKIPKGVEGFSTREVLEAGFAIDGNSAVCSVTFGHDNTGKYTPLADALREKQLELVRWFDDRGCEVAFA